MSQIHHPSNAQHIVAWDPKNEFWEGSIVEPKRVPSLRTRGAVLLPCDAALFRRGAGYVKRAWGAGFPLDAGTARMVSPLACLIFTGQNTVHWAARLVATPAFEQAMATGEFRPGGMLRFVGDGREATSHIAIASATPAIDVRELGTKDVHGGWTISGHGRINPPMTSYYGFSLYGQSDGLRVAWLAVTVTDEKQ